MVKVIQAISKINCEHLLGQFLDDSHYDILVEEDTDVFLPDNVDGTKNIACKFRKNYFSKEEQDAAYYGLKDAAAPSENRGLAAGPRDQQIEYEGAVQKFWVSDYEFDVLNFFLRPVNQIDDDVSLHEVRSQHPDKRKSTATRGRIWVRQRLKETYPDINYNDHAEWTKWFDAWTDRLHNLPRKEQYDTVEKFMDDYISLTNYAGSVRSGIAGYFDRYPRIPFGRATTYTRDFPEKFAMSFPFLQTLSKAYKELIPEHWNNQKKACDKLDQRFLVPDTVFSTITVNNTFRTAAHRDAGDFSDGFSNLLVLSNNPNYTGGYLVLPEYRVAINIRPGDLLLVNNHEIIHGNTPIVLEDKDAHRISLVCYLRENMLDLGSFDYEFTRGEFVENRKFDKKHKLWRPHWNGTSPHMWETEEWYQFLESKMGKEILSKYHPKAVKQTLFDFLE